jgi:hypothetical protein
MDWRIRKAEAKDIVQLNCFILLGDFNELYKVQVEEVLNPNDLRKAFSATGGCRYGLKDLWVIEVSQSETEK